jgi:protein SCO1/2
MALFISSLSFDTLGARGACCWVRRHSLAWLAAWTALAIGTVCTLSACQPNPNEVATTGVHSASAPPGTPTADHFLATDITGVSYAKDWALADAQGKVWRLADFKGRIPVVFFGYTQCPDVCPTTLATLARAQQLLGPQAHLVQPIFVTLDPERDTPAVLQAYVSHFSTAFLALRPTLAELPALARTFRVAYEKVADDTPGSYHLDHSTGSLVFDTQGKPRLHVAYEATPQAWASDLRRLMTP